MKLFFHLLPMLLTVFLIACATSHTASGGRDTKPDDFGVEYAWREGSLPPPYHYEYTVTIKPSGQGEIVLIPDYPAADLPKWAENFRVPELDMKTLYRVLVKNGLFARKWQQLNESPVGGSNQTLVVTTQGKRIKVEDHLISEQQDSAKAMYAAVQALIPKEIWDRLQAKRQQYMHAHSRR